MNRIEELFKNLTKQKRAGFAGFITAGDPEIASSIKIAEALLAGGADLIEIGMPFSDPMAEGKSIQASHHRALKAGTTMEKVFEVVANLRKQNNSVPIILMGYYNPVFSYGVEVWAQAAAKAGADGAIIVDAPPEEDETLRQASKQYGLAVIRLIAPTSEKRLPLLLKAAQGFLYYVSITGTTGASKPDFEKVAKSINVLRKNTDLPIALGFGIKTPKDSANAAGIADLVVVGSALVDIIAKSSSTDVCIQVKAFVKEHCKAIANVKKA